MAHLASELLQEVLPKVEELKEKINDAWSDDECDKVAIESEKFASSDTEIIPDITQETGLEPSAVKSFLAEQSVAKGGWRKRQQDEEAIIKEVIPTITAKKVPSIKNRFQFLVDIL